MVKHYCDICGKETNKYYYERINFVEYEMCKKCSKTWDRIERDAYRKAVAEFFNNPKLVDFPEGEDEYDT